MEFYCHTKGNVTDVATLYVHCTSTRNVAMLNWVGQKYCLTNFPYEMPQLVAKALSCGCLKLSKVQKDTKSTCK